MLVTLCLSLHVIYVPGVEWGVRKEEAEEGKDEGGMGKLGGR
jgi:hypothetical protein